MLNLAIFAVANTIIEEAAKGTDLSIHFANARKIALDDVLIKAIGAAKKGEPTPPMQPVDATLLYFAGSGVQVGSPWATERSGNGPDGRRGGSMRVVALPTPKWGTKFRVPGVQAIYQAMAEGKLTRVDGRKLPMGVGPFFWDTEPWRGYRLSRALR